MTEIREHFAASARSLQPTCFFDSNRLHKHCDGDADAEPISWEAAQDEASKWLGSLRLGRDLFGQTVDLSAKGDTLKFEGRFREMVLEAARRKLVKRRAKDIIMPL